MRRSTIHRHNHCGTGRCSNRCSSRYFDGLRCRRAWPLSLILRSRHIMFASIVAFAPSRSTMARVDDAVRRSHEALARCRADAIQRRGGQLHKFQRNAAHAESVLLQYRIAHTPPQFLHHNRQARQNVPQVGLKARPAGGCVAEGAPVKKGIKQRRQQGIVVVVVGIAPR